LTVGRDDPADLAPSTSDQELDEALALTFPASDPPAQTQPIVHIGAKTTNAGPAARSR
jgi:hypothetical protein